MPTRYLILIGEHSYFSAKLRSYMRYKGAQGGELFFDEALATLDMYRRVILPLTQAHFIPVLLVRDVVSGKVVKALQDTSLIIDWLESQHPQPSIHPPENSVLKFISFVLEAFGDEWMKFPAMHYRWSFLDDNEKYLVYEWGRNSAPTLPAKERDALVISAKSGPSFSAMKRTLPILGITENSVGQVEATFLELLDLMNQHFSVHEYLLGDSPSLADFSLYGPFFAHLYKDPKPSLIVRSRAPGMRICSSFEFFPACM